VVKEWLPAFLFVREMKFRRGYGYEVSSEDNGAKGEQPPPSHKAYTYARASVHRSVVNEWLPAFLFVREMKFRRGYGYEVSSEDNAANGEQPPPSHKASGGQ
jgi:hypothetical protein